MARCDREADGRPHEIYVVGLLGNRGVDPRRALDYLLRFASDPDVETRKWAVEGIAMLGTDDAIAPLLRAFHDDPSAVIRERAGCGLAQSGMLTGEAAVHRHSELLRFADDPVVRRHDARVGLPGVAGHQRRAVGKRRAGLARLVGQGAAAPGAGSSIIRRRFSGGSARESPVTFPACI